MMSPLSIAQFIEPQNVGNIMFDVIIFDEASQVKPEDALGALLRGKQLVVMGDTKQLPPTSFFDAMNDTSDDEDYDLTTLGDMQSILHLCKSKFTSKMLRWHYRSRHESLIAVSNQEYYDNHLLIYPSPSNDSDNLGLKFVHIPDAVYDRGRSSGNILEAKAVVKAVMGHYKKHGDTKSLGVGTFNTNQRRLIEDFLEIERKKRFFHGRVL
jgi:superfamily I DNA and/or RNA helicase